MWLITQKAVQFFSFQLVFQFLLENNISILFKNKRSL